MYIFLIVVHIIVCLILILTILLQAGRGGGLTDSGGGGGGGDNAQSVLGTQAPVMLKRATEVSAILFLITSLLIAVISGGKNRSLLNKMRMPELPSGSYTTPIAGADMTTAAQAAASTQTEAAKTVEKADSAPTPFSSEDVPVGK